MGDENPIRTLGDYSKPSHKGYRNTIELPAGNNVVPLRSDTIRLVQNGCSFHGLRFEDPNQHLKDFLKLVDSLDLDGSITTWEDLTTRFLAQLFSPGRTAKLRNDILMFQQHHEESLSEAFQFFYDHVNPVTRRTIDQSTGGKLCDRNTKESWVLLEDLALYDNQSWNDIRDFAKPVRAIALPQDVLSTSDCRLIELESQVQRLMEAHLAPTQPTQVNKITTSCEICIGPHDAQYYMEDPEQAFVEYASSCTDEVGGKKFTLNQGPRNFNDTTNACMEKPNFNWAHTQIFTSPQSGSFSVHSSSYQLKLEKALFDFDSHQEKRLSHLRTQLEQQQDDMIGKINLLWKTISERLNDAHVPESVGNPMASENIASISHIEREELKRKGIKSPSNQFSPKYLSPASIIELNKNP
ncbi:MAK10-like protein [Tanacetum coccineum]